MGAGHFSHLCCAILRGIAQVSRDMLQNKAPHRCACVKLSTKRGVSAPFWGSPNLPEKISQHMECCSDGLAISHEMGPLGQAMKHFTRQVPRNKEGGGSKEVLSSFISNRKFLARPPLRPRLKSLAPRVVGVRRHSAHCRVQTEASTAFSVLPTSCTCNAIKSTDGC